MKLKKKILRFFKYLLPLLIIGALVAGGWYLMQQKQKKPPPTYKTAPVERGDVMDYVSADGTLIPYTTVDVKSKAGGKVVVLAVDVGTFVKTGQLLAKIDPADSEVVVNTATADLEGALAKVDQARDNLTLQQSMLGPQVGQARSALDVASSRTLQARESLNYQKAVFEAQVKEAREKLEAARMSLRQAETELVLDVETQKNRLQDAEIGLKTAKSKLEQAKLQATSQPSITDAQIEQAEVAVKSAEEDISLLKNTTHPQEKSVIDTSMREARSNLDLAEANLKRHKDLYGQGFIPRNTLESSQNAYDRALAAYDLAKEKERQFEGSIRSRIRSAELRLEQALAASRLARVNSVQNSMKAQDVVAAMAAYEQALNTYRLAQVNRTQNTVREEAMKSARISVRQAEAALKTALTGGKQIAVRTAELTTARKSEDQAKESLNLALTGKLQLPIKAADIKSARASVERSKATLKNAQVQLDSTIIVSPRDGVILKKYVEEGTIITSGMSAIAQGTNIVQLADITTMFVDAQVDESDVRGVKKGQEVELSIDAFPDDAFDGTVEKIFPDAELVQSVNVIHVWVKVTRTPSMKKLKPGMSATCSFVMEKRENVLMVPREAVKRKSDENGGKGNGKSRSDGKGNGKGKDGADRKTAGKTREKKGESHGYYVQVLEGEAVVDRRVKVGLFGVENVEILEGLKEGEEVIVAVYEQKPAGAPGGSKSGDKKKQSSEKSLKRAMRSIH